jgi:hypothetical protein
MRITLIFLVSLLLSACSGFNTEQMFSAHVASVAPSSVHALQGGKVSCLHCPIYFSFNTDPNLTSKIISEHKLREIDTPTEAILQIEQLVKEEASWWQTAEQAEQDKTYWVEYKPKQPDLESAFRLLVVKNKKSFFNTSGHFDRAQYSLTM